MLMQEYNDGQYKAGRSFNKAVISHRFLKTPEIHKEFLQPFNKLLENKKFFRLLHWWIMEIFLVPDMKFSKQIRDLADRTNTAFS
jgi:hypothetical protein